MNTLTSIRSKYLSLSVYVHGQKAAKTLGFGHRVCYLVSLDSGVLVCYNTVGDKFKLPTEDLTILKVKNKDGAPLEFDISSGKLMVENGETRYDYGEWS